MLGKVFHVPLCWIVYWVKTARALRAVGVSMLNVWVVFWMGVFFSVYGVGGAGSFISF